MHNARGINLIAPNITAIPIAKPPYTYFSLWYQAVMISQKSKKSVTVDLKASNKVTKPSSAKRSKDGSSLPRPVTRKIDSAPASDSAAASNDRMVRLVTACMRCRKKKIKCDRKLPQCTTCDKIGADCVLWDPRTGETVKRMTIHTMETQLKEMTDELNRLRKEREEFELSQHINQFKFGKVLLMKDSEIQEAYTNNTAVVEIPTRKFVENCLHSYFNLTNIQIPILHRDFYLFKYFKPLYGIIGTDLWLNIFGEEFIASQCDEKHFLDEKLDKMHKGKCLFFLYIIIAILTSQHQQKYPLMISNHYKKQAFNYIDYVWNAAEGSDDELSKLEMLQSLLLLTQYSLMRPCTPGAWYLIGTCVRLCQDLGLHNETIYLHSDDYYIVDMKRRLFWCCYSLDRQISIYFGRQFGIDSRQIDCPLPSTRDDLVISYGASSNYNVSAWLAHEPQTKFMSIHFINLRVLQGDIFDFINDVSHRIQKPKFRGFVDSNYEAKVRQIDEWKSQKHSALFDWFNSAPSSNLERFEFNQMICKLNLSQTLIQLYGLSAVTPIITDERHQQILYDSGREIIQTYVKLVEQKMINFSWVAINNLYMGATAHLSLITQCDRIRAQVDLDDLKNDCDGVILVFNELCKICYEPAKEYTNKFKTHSAQVLEQCARERNKNRYTPPKNNVSSNIFSSVGGSNITPATFVAPLPQRTVSMFMSTDEKTHEDKGYSSDKNYGGRDHYDMPETLELKLVMDFNDQFLDNEMFLNTMMGSVNATTHEVFLDADSEEGFLLDPDFL